MRQQPRLREPRHQRARHDHGVAAVVAALRRECRRIERLMQRQRPAGQQPGHQREREAGKRADGAAAEDGGVLLACRPSSRPASPPAISSVWLRATGTRPSGVTSKVTSATWSAGLPSRSIGAGGSIASRGRAGRRTGSRRPASSVAEAADVADREHLRRHLHGELAMIDSRRCGDVVMMALAPMPAERRGGLGAPPQQRQRRRDHVRRAARRGASARSRPCWAAAMPTTVSVCRPSRRSRRRDRRDDAVGLGVGEAARRAVGEARAVGRIDERDRVRPRASTARRNSSSSVVWPPDRRCPPSCVAEDHGCARITRPHCGLRRRATRFPAGSRTARSPPDARSWSSARPIARAGGTAERRRSRTSARGRARARPRRIRRARAPASMAAIMASIAGLLTPM